MSASRWMLCMAGTVCVLAGWAPASAGAYATVAPPANPSTSSGLPDGRVYEEVSPANKHGYQAGALSTGPGEISVFPSVASPDGDAVSFGSQGPAADQNASGLSAIFVAKRGEDGWTSRSAMARGKGLNENVGVFLQNPNWLDYTPDLSHLAYGIIGRDVPDAPVSSAGNIYLSGENTLEEPTWLARPQVPQSEAEQVFQKSALLGISPDASVVYFAYEGHLLPQDASRSGWGIYEYRNGDLSEAGVLPDGSVPASGALPAATATSTGAYGVGENNPTSMDNQVSQDGRLLLFVSSGELYAREIQADGTERTMLVSASQVPGHVGEAAPDGVVLFGNPAKNGAFHGTTESAPTYAYGSPDGSHVFFQSDDRLTGEAPGGTEAKVYDFDVGTGALEYLPGVVLGGIVTAASDGSSFGFVSDAGATPELDLWSSAPGGGEVSQVVQLPGGGFVGPGRLVADDSVLVFQASAPIAGFNNVGGEQVYRYDTSANELSCVSCPPAGIAPSGNAYLSALDEYSNQFFTNVGGSRTMNDARGVSDDGHRVFFDSSDPIVGRDTNGRRDVYEWENGSVFLISSGTSPEDSVLLDNSQFGGDVFFAASNELEQGDNDQGFDVYDARVPRPGDVPPPAALPCQGDVCQGPPSVPQLLGPPPSATFNGVGNVLEQPVSKPKVAQRKLSTAQKLANALRACHKRKSKHKQVVCEKQARQRYRVAGAATTHNGRRGK